MLTSNADVLLQRHNNAMFYKQSSSCYFVLSSIQRKANNVARPEQELRFVDLGLVVPALALLVLIQ